VNHWSTRAELPRKNLVTWIGIAMSKFHDWKLRYGKINEHNADVPRDAWLQEWEKQAVLDYERRYPLEGYRRLAFMMLDDDVVAASPTSVYRVLRDAGRIGNAPAKNPRKGHGFVQPLEPHEHWHTDVSYLNIAGTFYFLISVLDGYSRTIVHWEIRERMTEPDVAIVLQRARETFPDAHPRLISDNGPQFLARDFKEFIRIAGMTHVRTSPYYPQANGKQERWFGTLKHECIRPHVPLSLDDARRLVAQFVQHYNTIRLHSALGYVAPADKLLGLEHAIFADRDQKLEAAREQRRIARQSQRAAARERSETHPPTDPANPSAPRAAHAAPPTAASLSSSTASPHETRLCNTTPASSATASLHDSPSSHTSSPSAPFIDFRALRRQVGFDLVLRRLGFDQAMLGSGPQRRGPCPLHERPDSNHRSFSVNLRKNVFQCFHPECAARGNVLDFWTRLRRLPIADAARDMCLRFGIRPEDVLLPNNPNREEATRTSSNPCLTETPPYDSVSETTLNPLTRTTQNSISR
jgi:transposase InsO family protein